MKNTTPLRIIEWIEAIAILSIIALAVYLSYPVHSFGVVAVKEPRNLIISQLAKEGYALSSIDQQMIRLLDQIKTGEVRFGKKRYERIDFLYKLTQARPPLVRLTLIPGETKYFFFKQIAKKLDVNETKLHLFYDKHAPYTEAAILADTYLAPKKMDEESLILFLLQSSKIRHKQMATKAFGTYDPKQWNKILTIASIIQKEAADNKEMPLIASVIYNRLKKNMRLQMDGTLNYGKYSHTKVTPQRIKSDTTHFNTYKYHGLPPSPIGSVSIAAIKAALYPASSNFYYFVRNKQTGKHDFSETFQEHRKRIKVLHKQTKQQKL